MKMRSKLTLATLGLVVVVGGGAAVASTRSADDEGVATVKVTRADIVDKALAVGTIEPNISVSVKSKVSGVVNRSLAEPGDYVEAGQPLLEIRPDPTPLELVESRREVELREIELANLKRDVDRQKALTTRGLAPEQAFEDAQSRYDEAELQVKMAREKLQLLESGRSAGVESMVRAPISGSILEKTVEQGDPVVPLTTYQEGTVLMTMADMTKLLFRGTVDEIDVGRLHEGMPVSIKIGALPDAKVMGHVSRISLQAKKEESATTFPVEIELERSGDATLRAGLSANADVIIKERKGVLTLPERVVTFEKDGTAWVTVQKPDATTEKRTIKTGLSDAIQVEIVSGLKEGEVVQEKALKEVK
jgi:HlyD family secretion protein